MSPIILSLLLILGVSRFSNGSPVYDKLRGHAGDAKFVDEMTEDLKKAKRQGSRGMMSPLAMVDRNRVTSRSDEEYVTKEEFDQTKEEFDQQITAILALIDLNQVNINENAENHDVLVADVEELQLNTVKRCESNLLKMYCDKACCRVNLGDCIDVEFNGFYKLSIEIPFERSFHKAPTLSVSASLMASIYPTGVLTHFFEFKTSEPTVNGFSIIYYFDLLELLHSSTYSTTWMACA